MTAFAQALPIAVSPILTRLHSPEEFGHFALYMAIAMIASVLVTGRYGLAILLTHLDKDALQRGCAALAQIGTGYVGSGAIGLMGGQII